MTITRWLQDHRDSWLPESRCTVTRCLRSQAKALLLPISRTKSRQVSVESVDQQTWVPSNSNSTEVLSAQSRTTLCMVELRATSLRSRAINSWLARLSIKKGQRVGWAHINRLTLALKLQVRTLRDSHTLTCLLKEREALVQDSRWQPSMLVTILSK